MKKKYNYTLFVIMISLAIGYCLNQAVAADYAAEIQDQIKAIQARYKETKDLKYFHDMAIIARKADEAELTELTIKIIRNDLVKPMGEYVEKEIAEINDLYTRDAYKASERLAELNKFERYYQPTQEFLNTAGGRALAGEFVMMRKSSLEALGMACVDIAIQQGLKAVLMTGLYQTGTAEEFASLRDISREVECCLSWGSVLKHENTQMFETDYEKGSLTETTNLSLQTDAKNHSEARWAGDWLYQFKGKEGVGKGVSQAILTYRRGSETADLVITASKVTSAGRMNFPRSLAGEPRTLNVQGTPLLPSVVMAGKKVLLNGCKRKG